MDHKKIQTDQGVQDLVKQFDSAKNKHQIIICSRTQNEGKLSEERCVTFSFKEVRDRDLVFDKWDLFIDLS